MSEAAKNLQDLPVKRSKYAGYKVNKHEALLMALQGCSRSEIASRFGVSPSAISQLLKDETDDIAGYIAFKRAPDVLYEYQEYRTLSNLTSEDIKKMPGQQKFIGAGIARDKVRLIRGESTANIDVHVNLSKISEIDAEIARLERLVK